MHRKLIATGLILLSAAPFSTATAQQIGTCESGKAHAYLDANNVRAAIYNAGNLFWRGSGNVYTVPKSGRANSVFAANLWIGGLVEGELRFAGTDYGPFEYFPGPLTDTGELPDPSNCADHDRIFKITLRDLEHLDETGEATNDIRDWPWRHGAPVADGDGNPDNYDLAAGDRPEITGHQMLWWSMNDLGGAHGWGVTPPLGIELKASAFAVMSTEPALNNTTFYRYEISNRQAYTLDSVYFGLWVDPDLGNAGDDMVGSDTTLGMGFTYNGDDFDDGSVGYGDTPPAIGFDFIRGPRAQQVANDQDVDGHGDEVEDRLDLTSFMYYNGDSSPMGNPHNGAEAYNYLRSIWRDGTHLTHGGTGYGGDTATDFHFPGDPVTGAFWSEENTDGNGSRNTPADRRFVMATGPFRVDPGDQEEFVLAVVWARGTDRLDSISELRKADQLVQQVWDAGLIAETDVPPVPATAPTPTAPADGVFGQPLDVTLSWSPYEYVSDYEIDIATTPDFSGPSRETFTTFETSVDLESLEPFTDYYWRVTALSAVFASPSSETMHFQTSDVTLESLGLQTIPGTNDPAFVEVRGPGGIDPCGPNALSRDGCEQTGGNFVYGSENSTDEFVMYHLGSGPEATIGDFAPNDFEIRFTEAGSYALQPFTSGGEILWVPFEVWDIGPVGFFNENDPSDDVRLIPGLFSDGGGYCEFGYGEDSDPLGGGWEMSDRIYGYYAVSSYEEWEAEVQPLVESSTERCYEPDPSSAPYWEMLDYGRGRPLQRVVFIGDPELSNAPGEGTIVRFYTTPPPVHSPIPAAPADGSGPIVQPMELFWNAPQGNSISQLQISADPTFGDPKFDVTTRDESFVVSGLDDGRTYYWRVRLSQPQGSWSDTWTFTAGEVTNVATRLPGELPSELTLEQNYPNPFNPSTTIRFGLPEMGVVRLEVYDVLGRRVATLIDATRTAGWHDVTWDASALGSGIYFYSIRTDHRSETRSMILVQ